MDDKQLLQFKKDIACKFLDDKRRKGTLKRWATDYQKVDGGVVGEAENTAYRLYTKGSQKCGHSKL